VIARKNNLEVYKTILRHIDPQIKLDGMNPVQLKNECLVAVQVLAENFRNPSWREYQKQLLAHLGYRTDQMSDSEVDSSFQESIDNMVDFIETGARFGTDIVDEQVFGQDLFIGPPPEDAEPIQSLIRVPEDMTQGTMLPSLPGNNEDKPNTIQDINDPPIPDGPGKVTLWICLALPQESLQYLDQKAFIPETDGVKLSRHDHHITLAYLGRYEQGMCRS
jgi:hypothetical protein